MESGERFSGEKFIAKKFPDLKKSEAVKREQERQKKEGGMPVKDPVERIAGWLNRIEGTKGHRNNPEKLERLKNYYHNEYVIKSENVPDSYFENQRRLAREQGHGDIEITPAIKQQQTEIIIKDQKASLDNWINYFVSPDADAYPMWAKYWSFRSMLKLSSYDKEKKAFGIRRKDTIAPFSDLNREALAYAIDVIGKKVNKENIPLQEQNPQLQKVLQTEDFGKVYAYAIEKVTPVETNELLTIEGEWKKYTQNSDPVPLVKSLEGHGTGWCTAGESTARTQLRGGDFYVYYSKDRNNNPTVPRAAIRMEGNQIGEVRGIAPEQNLDPYIQDVVEKKLDEFPDKEKYKKKTADMKLLTEIDMKHKEHKELTKDELKFLYEIEDKIEGFGYKTDPRIKEILTGRDIKSDLSLATGYPKEQISTTKQKAISGGIKFHYGDLDISQINPAEGLKLPEIINGDLILSLESAEGLKFPKKIRGKLDLSSLKSAEGLNLPDEIGCDLMLGGLKSAEGLNLPYEIGGGLWPRSLESAEGLNLPKKI